MLAIIGGCFVDTVSVADAGTLELTVLDDVGDQLPCRVLVRAGDKCLVAPASVKLPIYPDTWFMSPGRSELEVPDGEILLRVEHGPIVQQSLEEGLKMLTAFDKFAANAADVKYRPAIQAAVAQARQILNTRRTKQ